MRLIVIPFNFIVLIRKASCRYASDGKMYFLSKFYLPDTAGQQEFSIFPRSCSVDIDGYVLVYAIDDRKS